MITIVFSEKCLSYREPGHPETPERVEKSYIFLKDKGFEFIEPEPCSEEDLLLAHSRQMVEGVQNNSFFDTDTPGFPGIFEIAKLSAGGAIKACELALKNKISFSLLRPPGHHATKNNVGGFCYFNNIAIAVKKALGQVETVAIIDIDCHHGNGTEDIFLGEKQVLYVSLHQSPLYPGTGLSSHKNCLNFPLLAGTGEKEYLKVLNDALVEVKKFNPMLIAVSAGFDTYKLDPITDIGLETTSYRKIAREIKNLGKPVFSVLEGGYSEDLPQCIYEYLKGLSLFTDEVVE